MSRDERIIGMVEDLKTESEKLKLNRVLDAERAEKMLLLSECITAVLHGYLISIAREGAEINEKSIKPRPPFRA
jgi:hypothetical protein